MGLVFINTQHSNFGQLEAKKIIRCDMEVSDHQNAYQYWLRALSSIKEPNLGVQSSGCYSTICQMDTLRQYPIEHPPLPMPPSIVGMGAIGKNHFLLPISEPENVDRKLFFEKNSGRNF